MILPITPHQAQSSTETNSRVAWCSLSDVLEADLEGARPNHIGSHNLGCTSRDIVGARLFMGLSIQTCTITHIQSIYNLWFSPEYGCWPVVYYQSSLITATATSNT